MYCGGVDGSIGADESKWYLGHLVVENIKELSDSLTRFPSTLL